MRNQVDVYSFRLFLTQTVLSGFVFRDYFSSFFTFILYSVLSNSLRIGLTYFPSRDSSSSTHFLCCSVCPNSRLVVVSKCPSWKVGLGFRSTSVLFLAPESIYWRDVFVVYENTQKRKVSSTGGLVFDYLLSRLEHFSFFDWKARKRSRVMVLLSSFVSLLFHFQFLVLLSRFYDTF